MTEKKIEFISLVKLAVCKEALKKLVLSRPTNSEITKVSIRLCAHRGRRILAAEYFLPGNTVSHKNFGEDAIEGELAALSAEYRQANLITTHKDAEWKISSSGKEALLGADALKRRLDGARPEFESALEALDNRKKYILKGDEAFLITLGVSDKGGRVHDKKQGKYRQLNRFLEHIENSYASLPSDKELLIYDLCCGKSYLTFATYYYLTEIKGRRVRMLGMDLKRDVIAWCEGVASELGYSGMRFVCDDIRNTPKNESPDMVISLHACDLATDVVIDTAIKLKASLILSTPCCHRYLNDKINQERLSFVTDYPHLRNKLCEAITDSIRIARLKANGYATAALELTDPEDTPKNTLIRAIRIPRSEADTEKAIAEYETILDFVLGDKKDSYLQEIK